MTGADSVEVRIGNFNAPHSAELLRKRMNKAIVESHVHMTLDVARLGANSAVANSGMTNISGELGDAIRPSKRVVILRTRERTSEGDPIQDHESEFWIDTASLDYTGFYLRTPWQGIFNLRDIINNGYRWAHREVVPYTRISEGTGPRRFGGLVGRRTDEEIDGNYERVYYHRYKARLQVLIPIRDTSSLWSTVYTEEDAYLCEGQTISKRPLELFEAVGLVNVQSHSDHYSFSMPEPRIFKIDKVQVDNFILDHVRVRDVFNLIRSMIGSVADYEDIRLSWDRAARTAVINVVRHGVVAEPIPSMTSQQPVPTPPTPVQTQPPTSPPASSNINDIWDHVTIDRINGLHPAIRGNATAFILDAQSRGIYLRITNGYRTFAEQDALHAQGRTATGNIVTNARGGESWHNFGLAIDVLEFRNGVTTADNMLWETENWDLIGAIGRSHGFEWGGDWTSFVDRPHFQITFGHTTAELRNRRSQNRMEGGFVILT